MAVISSVIKTTDYLPQILRLVSDLGNVPDDRMIAEELLESEPEDAQLICENFRDVAKRPALNTLCALRIFQKSLQEEGDNNPDHSKDGIIRTLKKALLFKMAGEGLVSYQLIGEAHEKEFFLVRDGRVFMSL